MIGVNFQPGANGENGENGNGRPSSGSGVQEAIRILSLRLPRVMGAQGVAPMPLLTSQGSGGNPRVDSIVNQVLSRVMPGQQPPMLSQPTSSAMGGGPSFSGTPQQHYPQTQAPWSPPPGFTPRVVVDSPRGQPPRWPGQSGTDADLGGGGQPPGMFEPLPNVPLPTPPVPNFDEPIWRRPDYYGGGGDNSSDVPMF